MTGAAGPRVTLKTATSLDGRIATASGESRWITGEAARTAVHALRAAHDAVLIGAETAVIDDPELTVRTDPPPAGQPMRVVLDSRLRLSVTSRLIRTLATAPLLVVTARDADAAQAARLQAEGVRIARVARNLDGLDLAEALTAVAAEGVRTLLVEGGGRVAASFVAADLVDRIEWFRAPLLLGATGRPALGDLAYGALADAPRFKRVAVREVGPDLWETYTREEG